MTKLTAKIAGLMLLVVSLSMIGSAFADENEVVALKGEVQDLNNKVSSLESLVRSLQSSQKPAAVPTYVAPSGTPSEGGLLRAAEDIKVSGYIDTQYSLALNDGTAHRATAANGPGTGAPNEPTNPGRVFDRNQDSFTVNSAELDFIKEANPEGGAGFRIDVQMGEDVAVIDFDPSTDPDNHTFGLQQAYVQYVQPLGFWESSEILPHSVDIRAGRFVTLAGAEVAEAKDNWNLSRSFAFGVAIPATHTGLRTNFKLWKDKIDFYAGVNNGWDTSIDNNTGKTLELGAGYKPLDKVSVFHSIYFGPESNDNNGHHRFLSSNVLGWDVTDKLSLKGEFNIGGQSRVPDTSNTVIHEADWQTYAGYARYQFTDKFAMAFRMELLRQNELFTTTLDNTLYEQTYTMEYLLATNLISRLEYRWDKSNDRNAFDGDSNQQTLGAQLIYSFA